MFECCVNGNYPQQEDSPGFVAGVHQVPDVGESGHSQFGQVLHIWPQDGMFSNPQSPLRLWVQQIPNPLTIDLHVGHLEVEEMAFSHWTRTEQISLKEQIRASLPPQSRSSQDLRFLLFSETSPHTAENRDKGSLIRFSPKNKKLTGALVTKWYGHMPHKWGVPGSVPAEDLCWVSNPVSIFPCFLSASLRLTVNIVKMPNKKYYSKNK